MADIKFRISAKTDVGRQRQNNEDNFQAAADLGEQPMRWVNNQECMLGTRGALLVVADGMGGMNAGEVASAIAIDTVRQRFVPEKLTPSVMENRFQIEKFMNETIVEADKRIKAEAEANTERRGMGTTIVMAWILGNKLYVSWCGDSRAYIYNANDGLHQITKDHSYVQTLVDQGKLTRDEAFDYPESNIITRSLSDTTQSARPDSLLQPVELTKGDIVLLCSDGLSGMIRDNETEAVIRSNEANIDQCVDALIQAALDAGGSDNVTVCAMQVMECEGKRSAATLKAADQAIMGPQQHTADKKAAVATQGTQPQAGRKWLLWLLPILLIAVAAIAFMFTRGGGSEQEEDKQQTEQRETPQPKPEDVTRQKADQPASTQPTETTTKEATTGTKDGAPQGNITRDNPKNSKEDVRQRDSGSKTEETGRMLNDLFKEKPQGEKNDGGNNGGNSDDVQPALPDEPQYEEPKPKPTTTLPAGIKII